LESLERLVQVKSNAGETVEQYVASQLVRFDFLDALNLLGDFPSLEQAKTVRYCRLINTIKFK